MADIFDPPADQEGDGPHSPKHLPSLERIKGLKSILDPVYPLTVDEWRDLLMREGNYRYQLAWWMGFAEIYRSITADLPPEKYKEVFDYLLRRDRDLWRATSDTGK